MKNNLTWFDKNITPITQAYKDFVKEMRNTSPEHFFQDGERVFTEKGKKFMAVYNFKNQHEKAKKETHNLESHPYSIAEGNWMKSQEKYTNLPPKRAVNILLKSEGKQSLIFIDNKKNTAIKVDNPAITYKLISDLYAKELNNKTDLSAGLTNSQIDEKQSYYYRQYELEAKKIGIENTPFNEIGIEDLIPVLNSQRNPEYLKQFDINTQNTIKNFINNQNPNIMETTKEFDQVQYVKDQLKYLGFGEGEKLHKDVEKGIKSVKQQFEIQTTSDKALPENKVDFILKFNKTESGGVFLNSYNAKLTNEKGEEISHNFPVNRENTFTAKEAVNLLEGRAVKIEFQNPKTEQMEPAFVKFNFSEPKTEKGNYNFQNFYKNYGVDTANIVEKSNLIFDKPEYKENTIKSLEKGNIVKVKFELEDKVIEGKAVLNPQYKNLNLYDSDMNRINTNKPLEGLEQDNKHEKNNVKEQSIKR